MAYTLLDHTADAYVLCEAGTLEECFACAAYAMYDQMVDASLVSPTERVDVSVGGGTLEERLFNLLSEFIFITDVDGLVFSSFEVRFDGDRVECVAMGEPLDLKRHRPKTEVKAVTYHGMEIDPDAPSVAVLFDL
ncbi:MAG: archease [Thermoplasmatales archaeon]|nr:archease [Thermoplasmatales archaeon]